MYWRRYTGRANREIGDGILSMTNVGRCDDAGVSEIQATER